jgi:DNA processing protein
MEVAAMPAGPPPLDKGYEMLLDALAFEPATVEFLAARTHLAGKSVASMLAETRA